MSPEQHFRLRIPAHQRRDTLLALAEGIVLLMWLSLEDATPLVVSLLGASLGVLLVYLLLLRWFAGRALSLRQWLPLSLIIGGLMGLAAVGATLGLMLFKNGWHSHAAPDFPADVVVAMAARTPTWALAGTLTGAAAALIHYALHKDWLKISHH